MHQVCTHISDGLNKPVWDFSAEELTHGSFRNSHFSYMTNGRCVTITGTALPPPLLWWGGCGGQQGHTPAATSPGRVESFIFQVHLWTQMLFLACFLLSVSVFRLTTQTIAWSAHMCWLVFHLLPETRFLQRITESLYTRATFIKINDI